MHRNRAAAREVLKESIRPADLQASLPKSNHFPVSASGLDVEMRPAASILVSRRVSHVSFPREISCPVRADV